MVEMEKTDEFPQNERRVLTELQEKQIVYEFLFPAYKMFQSNKDVSFADALEPLFQQFNKTEGKGLLERVDVWNAAQLEIHLIMDRRRRGGSSGQQGVSDLRQSQLSDIQDSIDGWLDEHARAEHGDTNQFYSESSQVLKLERQVADIEQELMEKKAIMRNNKQRGRWQLGKRKARLDSWMAENDLNKTEEILPYITAQQ